MPATIEIQLEGIIPKEMEPATLFLFEEDEPNLNPDLYSPFVGTFSCPRCGTIGYVTHNQAEGICHIICGSNHCSA